MPKRKNPADATLRNVRADVKRDEKQNGELDALGARVARLSDAIETLRSRVDQLESRLSAFKPNRV